MYSDEGTSKLELIPSVDVCGAHHNIAQHKLIHCNRKRKYPQPVPHFVIQKLPALTGMSARMSEVLIQLWCSPDVMTVHMVCGYYADLSARAIQFMSAHCFAPLLEQVQWSPWLCSKTACPAPARCQQPYAKPKSFWQDKKKV